MRWAWTGPERRPRPACESRHRPKQQQNSLTRGDLIIRGRRVYLPTGLKAASIHIADGRIESIQPLDAPVTAPMFDAGELPVLPGLVDTHVHINEPGRT